MVLKIKILYFTTMSSNFIYLLIFKFEIYLFVIWSILNLKIQFFKCILMI